LLKGEQVGALFPHQRRLAALQALVERLMAAHELEEAISAARLATALARCNFIRVINIAGELGFATIRNVYRNFSGVCCLEKRLSF
jgi:hypothetical protein